MHPEVSSVAVCFVYCILTNENRRFGRGSGAPELPGTGGFAPHLFEKFPDPRAAKTPRINRFRSVKKNMRSRPWCNTWLYTKLTNFNVGECWQPQKPFQRLCRRPLGRGSGATRTARTPKSRSPTQGETYAASGIYDTGICDIKPAVAGLTLLGCCRPPSPPQNAGVSGEAAVPSGLRRGAWGAAAPKQTIISHRPECLESTIPRTR